MRQVPEHFDVDLEGGRSKQTGPEDDKWGEANLGALLESRTEHSRELWVNLYAIRCSRSRAVVSADGRRRDGSRQAGPAEDRLVRPTFMLERELNRHGLRRLYTQRISSSCEILALWKPRTMPR